MRSDAADLPLIVAGVFLFVEGDIPTVTAVCAPVGHHDRRLPALRRLIGDAARSASAVGADDDFGHDH
jgi:hypothetical protein